MKFSRKFVFTVLLITSLFLSGFVGFQFALSGFQGPETSVPKYFESTLPFSYIIDTNGTHYFMYNGTTWKKDWSSTDASAIFNACYGNITKGEIFVKAGDYNVSLGTIQANKNNTVLRGQGTATKLFSNAEANIIEVYGTATAKIHDVTVIDLWLEGPHTGTNYNGINVQFGDRVHIVRVKAGHFGAYNPTVGSQQGLVFNYGCEDCDAYECTFYDNGCNGMLMYGSSTYPTYRCRAVACNAYGDGVAGQGLCYGFSFSGKAVDCEYWACNGYNLLHGAYKFEGFSGDAKPRGCRIHGGSIYNVGIEDKVAIRIGDSSYNAHRNVVEEISFRSCGASGIHIYGDQNRIVSCQFFDMGTDHPSGGHNVLYVEVGDRNEFDNIYIDATGGGTTNVGDPLYINAGVTNTKVINFVSSNCQYDIIEDYGSNTVMRNVDVVGGGLSDNGGIDRDNANGGTIAHGLMGVPQLVTLTCLNATYDGESVIVFWDEVATTSSNISLDIYWANGTAITDAVIDVAWYAWYRP